jgi:hypothetical protein
MRVIDLGRKLDEQGLGLGLGLDVDCSRESMIDALKNSADEPYSDEESDEDTKRCIRGLNDLERKFRFSFAKRIM